MIHFFATIYSGLPVADVVGEDNYLDVSPGALGSAIQEPETDVELVKIYLDCAAVPLLAIKQFTVKHATTHCFESLYVFLQRGE